MPTSDRETTYRDHVILKVTDDKYMVVGWHDHSGYVTERAARRGIDRALRPSYTAGGALKVRHYNGVR